MCAHQIPQIREANGNDVHLLARLIRQSFRDVAERFGLTPDNCPTHPSNCQPEWIEAAFAKGIRYLILESLGEPCGCVALERTSPDVCRLGRLAVVRRHRRQGFGDTLLRHALAEARRMRAQTVDVSIISDHLELKAWYEKRGFSPAGSRRFEHLPFEVTFMQMRL